MEADLDREKVIGFAAWLLPLKFIPTPESPLFPAPSHSLRTPLPPYVLHCGFGGPLAGVQCSWPFHLQILSVQCQRFFCAAETSYSSRCEIIDNTELDKPSAAL